MKLAIALLSLVILGFVINVIGQVKKKTLLIKISRILCLIIVVASGVGFFLFR